MSDRNIRITSPGIADRVGHTLAVVLTAFLLAGAASADGILTVVSGHVEVGRGEPAEWEQAVPGQELGADDLVRTGADGRAEVKMAAGLVRVHENSMLRLPEPEGDADRVDLEQGRSLFDVLRRSGRRFEVHTPTVVVSVKGTRFGVDAGDDMGEVTVYRGTVGVRDASMDHAIETLVREGFLATGGMGLGIELDLAPEGDPWDQWLDTSDRVENIRRDRMRSTDVDRARATLHRVTGADVIRTAAKRRPEVADRLRQHQKMARENSAAKAEEASQGKAETNARDALSKSNRRMNRAGMGQAAQNKAVPASPMLSPDGFGSPKMQRLENHMALKRQTEIRGELRERANDRKLLIESMQAQKQLGIGDLETYDPGSGSFNNSDGSPLFDPGNLDNLDPQTMMILMNAMDQVEENVAGAPPGSLTHGDLVQMLTAVLVNKGLPNGRAHQLVNQMLNR